MPWMKTSLALLETIGEGRFCSAAAGGSLHAAPHKYSILYKTSGCPFRPENLLVHASL
jgi:hypothetical protein